MRKPFYIWSAFAAVAWIGGHRLADLAAQIGNTGLRDAVHFLLALVDPVWFVLAAAVVYLATARKQGLATARRWVLLVIGSIAVLLAVNASSTWPLGPILYTDHLGIRLAKTPVALPLFWFAAIFSGRDLLGRIFPRASHGALALGTGSLVLLTEIILEPLAQHERSLWFWYHPATHTPISAPWHNYLSWFLVTGGLTFTLRDRQPAPQSTSQPGGSCAVLVFFLSVFLATHLRGLFLG